MFWEHSGDFYAVWENFGKKGILVIFGKFLSFPCSSGISDPEMMLEFGLD